MISAPQLRSGPPSRTLVVLTLAWCLLVAYLPSALASQPLLIKQGDTKILKFDKMKRVWVANPEIIDVVVAGYHELLVYTKSTGRTKLFVWDARGRHEYAVEVTRLPTSRQVVRELQDVLGRSFKYTLIDEQTLLIEGEVRDQFEKERISKILEAKSDGLKILDLVTTRSARGTPAERHRDALQNLFPDQFRYSILDDTTLLIEGEVATAAEMKRVATIIGAIKGITVVDLVQCLESVKTPKQQRVESIQRAIGASYQCQLLDDGVVVISGEAPSEAERERISKIIAAAGPDITVANLVTVRADLRPPATQFAETLTTILGAQYRIVVVNDEALTIEGMASNPAEEARLSHLLELAPPGVRVVNLVTPQGATPADRAVAMIQRSFGSQYRARAVDENVIIVEGTASSLADKARLDSIIAAVPSTVKVVSMVAVDGLGPEPRSPAGRYAQALRPVLGEELTYRELDENTLLIEGTVPTPAEKERLDRIVASLDGAGKILNLTTVRPDPQMAGQPDAARKAQLLRKALGDKYQYRIVDDHTLAIEGVALSPAEKQGLDNVLTALGGPTKYLNLVTTMPESTATRLAETLPDILGQNLIYRVIGENSLVIEGQVETESEKERLDRIVASLDGAGKILNLTTVRPDPQMAGQPDAARKAQLLRKALGDKYQYRIVDDHTLAIEGVALSPAEKQGLDNVLTALGGPTKYLNLVTTMPESTATRLAETLPDILGQNLIYRVIGENSLVIEGQVETESEKERISSILRSIPQGTSIVDLVTVKPDPTARPKSEAERRVEALRALFGPDLTYRVLSMDTVAIEGTVDSAQHKQRIDEAAQALGRAIKVLNLTVVKPGGEALQKAEMLKPVLGPNLRYLPLDDKTLLIEGEVATTRERDRIDGILRPLQGTTSFINLVRAKDDPNTVMFPPAEQMIALLRPVLDKNLTYRALGDTTVLIEGQVANAGEKERLDKILEALSGKVTLLSLISIAPGPEAFAQSRAAKKAEAMARVLGDQYTCTAVDEKTILIEGVAPGEAEVQRIGNTAKQMAENLTVINMVLPEQDADKRSPAQRGIAAISPALPKGAEALAIDDTTILLRGVVETSIEKQSADKLAELISKSAKLNVLSLVLSQTESKTPAARRVEALRKLLGDKFNYIIWDDETVLVDGTVDTQAELERVKTIIEASNKEWKVGNLVTYGTGGTMEPAAAEDLAERLASAIGEPFRVWHLKGRKFVVEGLAPDQDTIHRLNVLLEAFKDEADIINLATVSKDIGPTLLARVEALRTVLGDRFQVKTLQGKAIVVEGTLTSKQEADRAKAIITAMGDEVPVIDLITTVDPAKRQVLVHAKVLDVNRGYLEQRGMNWGQLVSAGGTGQVAFGDQPILIQVENGAGTVSQLAANLNLSKTNDNARVLSEPNLLVNEGEQAEIVVGGEVPIPVPQLGVGTTAVSIEYHRYGVILRIKPTIMGDGKTIKLDVEPEVSAIDPATQVVIGGFSVPAFRTRRAKTVVDMPAGSTLVIGGLLSNNQSKVVRQIPILGKLPIIGELFRSTEWRQGNTELIILVSPEILQAAKPQDAAPTP